MQRKQHFTSSKKRFERERHKLHDEVMRRQHRATARAFLGVHHLFIATALTLAAARVRGSVRRGA
jgi:hypothetical protein